MHTSGHSRHGGVQQQSAFVAMPPFLMSIAFDNTCIAMIYGQLVPVVHVVQEHPRLYCRFDPSSRKSVIGSEIIQLPLMYSRLMVAYSLPGIAVQSRL